MLIPDCWQIHGLRQRIEALEARPYHSQAELDSLKRGVASVADKVSVDLGPSFGPPGGGGADQAGLPSSANYFESQAHHDIPVHGSELDRILVGTGHKDASGPNKEPSATPSRVVGSGIDVKGKTKPRKPELSRAVRQTIFKMMGVTPGTSGTLPGGGGGGGYDDGTPSRGTKFGPDHARAFHGYTANAQALLPDFTPDELADPATGEKLWRWDWSKTIRQSAHNAAFMAEIHNTIARAVEDPDEGAFPEVPTADWQHLDEAIESAYTNMRRERDSQSDPEKLAKRGRHRLLTKKRGIKEEKLRRRRKALDELRTAEGQDRLIERGVQIPVEHGPDEWESAMDINLMSSEEEGGPAEPVGTVDIWEPGVGMVQRSVGSSTNSAKGKSFVVSKPAWRSDQAKVFLAALDALRGNEKSAKRIAGPEKQSLPPVNTPDWSPSPPVFLLSAVRC